MPSFSAFHYLHTFERSHQLLRRISLSVDIPDVFSWRLSLQIWGKRPERGSLIGASYLRAQGTNVIFHCATHRALCCKLCISSFSTLYLGFQALDKLYPGNGEQTSSLPAWVLPPLGPGLFLHLPEWMLLLCTPPPFTLQKGQ